MAERNDFEYIDLSLHHGTSYDPSLLNRQRIFVDEVLRDPGIGAQVRVFSWTFGLLPVSRSGKIDERVFAMMEWLGNVEKVLIDVLPGHGIESKPPTEVKTLFPKAKDITLKGEVHENYAAAVLLGEDKVGIETLTVENLEDGYWMCSGFSARVLPLVIRDGRCKKVDYLRLKKESLDFWHPESDRMDGAIYGNWACFVVMAKPRHLSLEHGIHAEGLKTTNDQVRSWTRAGFGTEEGNPSMSPPQSPPATTSSLEMEAGLLSLGASDMRLRKLFAPNVQRGWEGFEKLTIRSISQRAMLLPHDVRCRVETPVPDTSGPSGSSERR